MNCSPISSASGRGCISPRLKFSASDGYTEDTNFNGPLEGDANSNRVYNAGEAWTETNPLDWDTDDDQLPDGWESQYGFDALDDGTNSLRNAAAGDGNPVNAVHGFARFLGELLEKQAPTHIAVAFARRWPILVALPRAVAAAGANLAHAQPAHYREREVLELMSVVEVRRGGEG